MSGLPKLDANDDAISTEVIAFVRETLRQPLPRSKDIVSVTIPAPIDAAEKFLRLVPRDRGFLWRSAVSREQFAGGGAAATIKVRGADRFKKLAEAVPALFARVAAFASDGDPPAPVIVGGASFQPDQRGHDAWEEFEDDEFTLPRWGYRRGRNRAALTISLHREELLLPGAIDAAVSELQRIMREFTEDPPTSLIERFDPEHLGLHQITLDEWWDYIDSIHAAIRSGEFKKIVAARRCTVELDRELEDVGFIARVYAAYPDTIHYAMRRAHSTFFGATPETLFRKRGLHLKTHALAGTTRIQDDPGSDSSRDIAALANSQKDLDEHSYVVEKICSELEPLTIKIERPSRPETRQVRNLIHLQTPISATLRAETSAFDLLEALHPTPAVGGFPAREAAHWIVKNEPLERGWYSGTVGWLDADGDAEFAVSIRCGVLNKKHAYVFAGAGIVEASDAAAEYAETAAKMWPVLRALGAPKTGLADAAPPPISERNIRIEPDKSG